MDGSVIPFNIERVYYIFDTGPGVIRGKHAHKDLEQILICVKGSCTVLIDSKFERKEYELNRPDQGLYVSSMVWREMYNFSNDCVLLVLANKSYDPDDYIHDYNLFREMLDVQTPKK